MLVPLLITGAIIYIHLSGALLKTAEEKAASNAEDIATLLQGKLEKEITLVSAIAADPDIVAAVKTNNPKVESDHLVSIHDRIGGALFTLFSTDANGVVRTDAQFEKQIGLDLSDRSYFKEAKLGLANAAGPFPARGTVTPGAPVVVVVAPIMERGKFLGMVGMVFNAKVFSYVIARKKSGATGRAFLINDQGLVLIHPNEDFIFKKNILAGPGNSELKELIRSKKNGTVRYTDNKAAMVAGLAGVGTTGWIAVFSQNRGEVIAPVNRILTMVFTSGILFVAIAVLIIYFLSSKISNPIQKTIELMDQVTRHSSELIVQIGADGKIIHTNPAFNKLVGRNAVNLTASDLGLTGYDDASTGEIWRSLAAGNSWSGRVCLRMIGNERLTLETVFIPITGRSGSVETFLALGRDVSAELAFQKRSHQAQKLEAVGAMAGGIAHDFNNILGGILGYAELSLMKSNGRGDLDGYLRQIISASERARDLVAQILAFSRKSDVKLTAVTPKAIILEAYRLLRASGSSAIDIQLKLDSDAQVMAGPTQIHQVVMNLVTNAIQAIGDKTGTVSLSLEDFWVDREFIRSHPGVDEGKHVIIRVSDTGPGIDSASVDYIFDPFFTSKAPGKGSGLGLSVVHGIVKSLNGIITVYSEVGKGAVFSVIIPVAESEAAGENPEEREFRGGTERIAVIDDEPTLIGAMESILTNLGYEVTIYADGRAALDGIMSDRKRFDLVITDQSMPRATGLEVIRELRSAGVSIPVILASGKVDPKLEEEAGEVGAAEMLTKPIGAHQLAEAIRRVLD